MAEAEARGMAVEEYAGSLLRNGVPASAAGSVRFTPESAREMSTAFALNSEDAPILPLEVNDRESYHQDRW